MEDEFCEREIILESGLRKSLAILVTNVTLALKNTYTSDEA